MFGIHMGSNGNDANVKVVVDRMIVKETIDRNLHLVGAIDQGTSSTRFVIFSFYGQIVASAQIEHKQFFPSDDDKVGWHEHDPMEIWDNVVSCIDAVVGALKNHGINLYRKRLTTVGITNQRETTMAWNADTGVPYYNAIVWDDLRTADVASDIARDHADKFRTKTGLPVASYFAGTKVKWLLSNVMELQADLQDPTKRDLVRFGTIDTWLMYQLTGTKSNADGAANCGGIFITDVSNASRWLFLDLETCQWDSELVDDICAPYDVPMSSALPEIRSSSEVYATCSKQCGIGVLDHVPIASILGDQQAALFGQCAFSPGEAKSTYGTGLFLMMNTGETIVPSTHGLLTTVAYKLGGPEGRVHYALEGSVSHSGSTIQWLRDQVELISDAAESETLARTTEHNDGVYFVPAFSGLFAPHWRADARGCIVGMTASCHKGHLCRAALEAAAYQTRELFDAINADSHVSLSKLKVDGGGTANDLLMQFQADILDIDVIKPVVMETTSRGAAFAAGLAVGVWSDVEEVHSLWEVKEVFQPSMSVEERDTYWKGWRKAVSKSLGWIELEEYSEEKEEGDGKKDRELLLPSSEPKPEKGFSGTTLAVAALCGLAAGMLLSSRARNV